MDKDDNQLLPTDFKPSPMRWYILLLTGLLGMVQSLIWMGWGTVSQSMYFVYPEWTDADIGLLGNWGEIMFLVFSVPATWLVETKGARVSGLVCATFMALGAGVRCLQWLFLDSPDAGFIFKILAHTGLSWLMLESGNALGFIVGPLMVSDPPLKENTTIVQFNTTSDGNVTDLVDTIKVEVMEFITLQACVATLLLFLIIIYYPARPKDLPSFTAGAKREDFVQGLKSFMTNKNAVMVCIAFTISQGVAESFYPVLDLNFAPIGVSESTTGSIGFISSVVASIVAFLISFFVERMKGSYKRLIVILLISASGFYAWMLVLVAGYIPLNKVQLYCSTIGGSAINYACTPLMLELASEVAYPVGEGVVSGVMTFFWTLTGIIYLSMFFIPNLGFTWMNWTMVGAVIVSIIPVLFIKETFNRTDLDNNNDAAFKDRDIGGNHEEK